MQERFLKIHIIYRLKTLLAKQTDDEEVLEKVKATDFSEID